MDGVGAALSAEFRVLKFALDELLVFARVVVRCLTFGAAQTDDVFGKFRFSHMGLQWGLFYLNIFEMAILLAVRSPNGRRMEPMARIELATYSLPWSCSTS